EELLKQVFSILEESGWSSSMDTGWKSWDVQVYGNFWWMIKLRTVTEYHGGAKCLTRVRLGLKMTAATVLFNMVVLPILIYRQAFTSNTDEWAWILYAVYLLWIGLRARRLQKRVAELVISAGQRCGMNLV